MGKIVKSGLLLHDLASDREPTTRNLVDPEDLEDQDLVGSEDLVDLADQDRVVLVDLELEVHPDLHREDSEEVLLLLLPLLLCEDLDSSLYLSSCIIVW